MKLPDQSPSMMDVNPSIGYSAALTQNGCSCLCSTSTFYIAHRGRCALGVEHLRLICFYADLDILKQFPPQLLKDLAGNAFDAASYAAAALTMFRLLAECSLRKKSSTASGRSTNGSSFLSAVWSG